MKITAKLVLCIAVGLIAVGFTSCTFFLGKVYHIVPGYDKEIVYNNPDFGEMYVKFHYASSDIMKKYSQREEYFTVTEKNMDFIKCWIRSYKIFIEDHQSFDNIEGYDGIDFDENTDLCCGDRVFLEMDVYKQHDCSEPLALFYKNADLYYVSLKKQTVYCFSLLDIIFRYYSGQTSYYDLLSFNSERFKDEATLISKVENGNTIHGIPDDYFDQHKYYYSLNFDGELTLYEILLRKDSIDLTYGRSGELEYRSPTIVLGYEFNEERKTVEDYFEERATQFGFNNVSTFEVEGVKFMKIETLYDYLYFWQENDDFIRLIIDKEVLKTTSESELLHVEKRWILKAQQAA